MGEYAELHCHSHYSLLDGASSPAALVRQAQAGGLAALALTDHDGLYGAVPFWQAAQEAGLPAIIGAELTLASGAHLVLLAESQEGYSNLCRLISAAQLAGQKGLPRLGDDLLAGHARGLIALSGCACGEVPAALRRGDHAAARARAGWYREAFGPANYCLELQRHWLQEDRALTGDLAALAQRLATPCVATNDVHYARPEGQRLHDVLTAIRHHSTVEGLGERRRPNAEYYLKTPAEMAALFADLPEALAHTLRLAERCQVRLNLREQALPAFPLPPGQTPGSYLRALCLERLPGRYPHNTARAQAQLERELAVIDQANLAAFFLVVWEVVAWAQARGIRMQGRGSAAGSLVACLLQISPVDPLAHNLLFERFLSGDPQVMPDIDLDIAADRREEVIQHVYERYGEAHTAMVCNVVTYRARSALREVAKALGYGPAFVQQAAQYLKGHRPEAVAAAVGRVAQAEGPAGSCRETPARHEAAATARPLHPVIASTETPARHDAAATARPLHPVIASTETPARHDAAATARPLHPVIASTETPARHEAAATARPLHPVIASTETPARHDAAATARPLRPVIASTETLHPVIASAAKQSPTQKGCPALPGDCFAALAMTGQAACGEPAAWGPPLLNGRESAPEALPRPAQLLLELCREIEGCPRHLSIHVGGMVITAAPLVSLVPVERATMPGRVVVQWNKDAVEDAGLIKLDLLGLRTLGMLDEAVRYVREAGEAGFDPARLPADDAAVYAMIGRADTMGVFQIESRAQMAMLPRTRPRTLADLAVEVALVRPGPIQGGMVHPYLRRRAGLEPVSYLHPALRPILSETLGVIVFQEQVLRVAMALGGFDAPQADRFRRLLGRSPSAEALEPWRERFVAGAEAKGVATATAEAIFGQLCAFAGYGFCKSHAAAFALLTYQTAYLKRYHPAAFLCALLNHQPMGFYAPRALVRDAQRHGIRVLGVDVNRSRAACTLEGGAVRLGYRYVAGLGPAAWARWQEAREAGPFADLEDFCRRTGLPRKIVADLVRVGAMDAWGVERRALLWELGRLDYREGTLSWAWQEPPIAWAPLSAAERLGAEYGVLGVGLGEHVMALYRPALRRQGLLTSGALAGRRSGERVRVAGEAVIRQTPPTAKGYAFITLEDEEGLINLVLPPPVVEEQRMVLDEPLLVAQGVVQRAGSVVNVRVERIAPLQSRS